MEEIRRLQTRMDALEENRQQDPVGADISDNEEEPKEEREVEADRAKIRLLKSMIGASMRPKPEVPTYQGGLDANELLDWINEMDKLFDYDETNEERKVKFAVTRLKGHASLWWNGVQTKRRNPGKVPIKNWDRMVAKLRGKFLPKKFQISLFKKMQNLKQKAMIVRDYTEFYKINLRVGYVEDTVEKVAR